MSKIVMIMVSKTSIHSLTGPTTLNTRSKVISTKSTGRVLVSVLGMVSIGATLMPSAKLLSKNMVQKLSRMVPKMLLSCSSQHSETGSTRKKVTSSMTTMVLLEKLSILVSELGKEPSTATLLQNAKMPSRNTDLLLLRLE